MPDLRELYQEVILDHDRKPRNFRELDGPCRKAQGHNPLCGDELTVYVHTDGETITDISFRGTGCAISTAAASMMTQALKGKTLEQARAIFGTFHDVVAGDGGDAEGLGKLAVFAGVREFPVRVKCATLAWHTMLAAIEGKDTPVSTE